MTGSCQTTRQQQTALALPALSAARDDQCKESSCEKGSCELSAAFAIVVNRLGQLFCCSVNVGLVADHLGPAAAVGPP
jgi:hypothetical protein